MKGGFTVRWQYSQLPIYCNTAYVALANRGNRFEYA